MARTHKSLPLQNAFCSHHIEVSADAENRGKMFYTKLDRISAVAALVSVPLAILLTIATGAGLLPEAAEAAAVYIILFAAILFLLSAFIALVLGRL